MEILENHKLVIRLSAYIKKIDDVLWQLEIKFDFTIINSILLCRLYFPRSFELTTSDERNQRLKCRSSFHIQLSSADFTSPRSDLDFGLPQDTSVYIDNFKTRI